MLGSLSARRAWIEIGIVQLVALAFEVALRKESVDRNIRIMSVSSGLSMSLSARRAWIEITVVGVLATLVTVALRKESVDRNKADSATQWTATWSLSARRAWIEMIMEIPWRYLI